MNKVKALVVEDDVINVLVFREYFNDILDITVAHSGQEAIEVLGEGGKYQFILLDINLGDERFTGVDVLKHIKKNELQPQAKIFALTGYAMSGDGDRFLSEGFDNYISKPIDFGALKRELEKQIPA